MLKAGVVACVLVTLCAVPAAAQSSTVYAGALGAVDWGSRGPIEGGAIPMAGGLVGLRLSDRWSAELEIEQGFRTSRRMYSLYPVEKAGVGWSALAVWRTRSPGRLSAALSAGYTARRFHTEQPEN